MCHNQKHPALPSSRGSSVNFLEKDVYYYNEIPNLSIKNNNNGGQLGDNEYNLVFEYLSLFIV